jgi:hypothetical protein
MRPQILGCKYIKACSVHVELAFTNKIYHFSRLFKCFPFFPVLLTSILPGVVPFVYPVFNMWFLYPELLLLLIMARMYSF